MVVAEVEKMQKPSLTVSVSDSGDSSIEDSDGSENDVEMEQDGEADAESDPDAESEPDMESEQDTEQSTSDDDVQSENDVLMVNEGWADSVTKILGSSKPKNKKTLVLSRAKKHSEIIKKENEEKPAFEVIGEGEVKEEKPQVKKEDPASAEVPEKKRKHEKPSIRVKPNILEKDRERILNKIATKGVVQLFNAVRNQQKTLDRDIERKDLSESKKEKILKKFDKRTFLDSLMGQTKSVVVDDAVGVKDEVKDEDKPRWNALRDDFMMGAKMKDWDKESVDDDE